MRKAYIATIPIGLFLAIIGVGYLHGSSASQPVQAYVCKSHGCDKVCNGSTRCVLEYQDGKKEYYCCPGCGFPNRMQKLIKGEHIRRVTVIDFETGKTINAVGTYYLIGSKLRICCSPSILAFHTKSQAERFQQVYGGTISHLSQ
jgi:hypothetical protein